MSVLIDAINSQIEYSVYENQSKEAKYKLASQCEIIKKIAIVAAIVCPVFAFFLPTVFRLVACLAIGLVGYDIFNMADNLGDAAKLSAEGGSPGAGSNMDMLVESTLVAKPLYKKILSQVDSQMDLPHELSDSAPVDAQQEQAEVETNPEPEC